MTAYVTRIFCISPWLTLHSLMFTCKYVLECPGTVAISWLFHSLATLHEETRNCILNLRLNSVRLYSMATTKKIWRPWSGDVPYNLSTDLLLSCLMGLYRSYDNRSFSSVYWNKTACASWNREGMSKDKSQFSISVIKGSLFTCKSVTRFLWFFLLSPLSLYYTLIDLNPTSLWWEPVG